MKLYKLFYTNKKILNILSDYLSINYLMYLISQKSIVDFYCLNIKPELKKNKLYHKFIDLFSSFISNESGRDSLGLFLSDNKSLTNFCKDFVEFCKLKSINEISLGKNITLQSFAKHNEQMHKVVESNINSWSFKQHYNIFGFGCDDGSYEKELGSIMKTESFNVYGYDPYATKGDDVIYLSEKDLKGDKFIDVVVARWSLHHVKPIENRWHIFKKILSLCKEGAKIIIIEHGFVLKRDNSFVGNLYQSMMGVFDAVANIGIRNTYALGEFDVQYLTIDDLHDMNIRAEIKTIESVPEQHVIMASLP